jgi:hypothetical protein
MSARDDTPAAPPIADCTMCGMPSVCDSDGYCHACAQRMRGYEEGEAYVGEKLLSFAIETALESGLTMDELMATAAQAALRHDPPYGVHADRARRMLAQVGRFATASAQAITSSVRDHERLRNGGGSADDWQKATDIATELLATGARLSYAADVGEPA